jgi:hypothetical protein
MTALALRGFAVALSVTAGLQICPSGASASDPDCNSVITADCPTLGVTADPERGEFHGLIMVPGQPSILETAAHSGTKPACGDCTWTVIMACPKNVPDSPDGSCAGGQVSAECAAHGNRLLFRLYLTDAHETLRPVGTICLGGAGISGIVPVGDIALADVDRYLKDVHPPDLALTTTPRTGIPAGMPIYFMARPPADLRPSSFGGGQVTETITIVPASYDWTWGDGQATTGSTDAGAPYPNGTLSHVYARAGHLAGTLTTHWGATYTITVAGQTFGPYDVTDTVPHTQAFTVTVFTARSQLVSHG